MTPEAIKKREYRRLEKEKRRETIFTHAYVKIKYPTIYKEVKEAYTETVAKYPAKPDITKTYYFRKWCKQVMKNQGDLMSPHLPVLMPLATLQQYRTPGHEAPSDVVNPAVEIQSQSPAAETQFNQHVVLNPDEEGYPAEIQQTLEIRTSDSTQTARTQSDNLDVDQTVETQSDNLDVDQTVETRSDNLVVGPTLQEMQLSVDEIVKALQSDRELMDLVEGFDLPDGVWDNELAVPDYVLQSDLEW